MGLKNVIIILTSIVFQQSILFANDEISIPTINAIKNSEPTENDNLVRVNSKRISIKSIETAIEFVQIPRIPTLFEPFCRSFKTFLNVIPMWTNETFYEIPTVAIENQHSYQMDLAHVPLSLFCQMKPMRYYIRLEVEIPNKGISKIEFLITNAFYHKYYSYSYTLPEGDLYQNLSTFSNCKVGSSINNINCNFNLDRFERFDGSNGVPFSNSLHIDLINSQIDTLFPNGFLLELE